MLVRKERVHQMGASNTDYKAKFRGLENTDGAFNQTRLEFLSTQKAKKPDAEDTKLQTVVKPTTDVKADVLAATKTFYKESGKKVRDQIKLGHPRTSELEEPDKRKIVFTGESNLIYDKHFEGYVPHEKEEFKRKKTPGETSRLTKNKHEENAKASQETQLIGMDEYTHETLKDRVDLQKVREVRRAIRRRYANRKNMKKIFSTWDEDNVGKISVKNVFNMVNRLGININFDESRVLVASADKNNREHLALDEFLDLIYNNDDALNINLANIPVRLNEDLMMQKEDVDRQGLLGYLQEDAKQSRAIKHDNQIKMVLKNRLPELNSYFYTEDANQAGAVNYDKFERIVKKLGINENVLTEDDIKKLFEGHRLDQHNINYKDFLGELKEFKFDVDNIYRKQDSRQGARGQDTARSKASSMFHPTPESLQIVDARNQPYPTLENFFAKNRKITRHLKRLFPNKKEFEDYAAKVLEANDDKLPQKTFSKEDMKTFFTSIFDKIDVNFTKRDLEGFYSSFIYNRNGFTDFNEIEYTIYDEDAKTFFQRAQKQVKGPAPHREIATITENDGPDDELIPDTRKSKTAVPRSRSVDRVFDPTNRLTYDTGMSDTMMQESEIYPVLQRFEDRVFSGRPRAYDVFKKFDVDKDGFVSHKDLAKKLEEMSLANKEETKRLIEYVDPENKGYVTFNEFNKKLRTNMTQHDENGNPKMLPYIAPSQAMHNKITRNIEYIKQKENELKKSYLNKPQTAGPGKTRFGATPAWTNTFQSFQPPSDSPMFLDEGDRFTKDPMARVRFQKDEKAKRLVTEASRVGNIRAHNELFGDKLQQEDTLRTLRDQNKMRTKLNAQTAYEQQCHLRNQFL